MLALGLVASGMGLDKVERAVSFVGCHFLTKWLQAEFSAHLHRLSLPLGLGTGQKGCLCPPGGSEPIVTWLFPHPPTLPWLSRAAAARFATSQVTVPAEPLFGTASWCTALMHRGQLKGRSIRTLPVPLAGWGMG